MTDRAQDAKDATDTLGVANALVHGVAHCHGVAQTLLVEQHTLCLRGQAQLFAGWRVLLDKIQRTRVSPSGSRDEPDAIGLEGVHLERAILGVVGEGLAE